MKIILFVLIASFTQVFSGEQMISPSNTTLPMETADELPRKIKIEVEIDFGRMKINCIRLGVCGVKSFEDGISVIKGNGALAMATVENGQINSLEFLRSSMTRKTLEKYFPGKAFIVEENFSTTVTHKGQKYSFKIKEGKYPLQKSKAGFIIGL